MTRGDNVNALIDELMPSASVEERQRARERTDDYVRLLMRMAERLQVEQGAAIRGNASSAV